MRRHSPKTTPDRVASQRHAAEVNEVVSALSNLLDERTEEAVFGCMLLDPPRCVPVIARAVSRNDFHDEELGGAVDICVQLHQAGQPISDFLVLMPTLKAMGFEQLTLARISKLVAAVPNVAHVQYYADRVRELARLRRIYSFGESLLARVVRQTAAVSPDSVGTMNEADSLLDWIEGQSSQMRHGQVKGAELLATLMDRVVDNYETRLHTGMKDVLHSGFPSADERGFVFAPGELTIIAARPNIGKTTLATQIGIYHAERGKNVLMASLEMKGTEVATRILSAAAGYNHQALRVGDNINQECVRNLREAISDYRGMPFRLWSPGRVKVGAIHAMANVCKASDGLHLLIVDILQCVRPDFPGDPEHIAFGKITKGIRDIAQQLNIPVIFLAQLNRSAENERPRLANLKGSGSIEEDADVVAMLHRPSRTATDCELLIEKNRFGTLGSCRLGFIPHQTRFIDGGLSEGGF